MTDPVAPAARPAFFARIPVQQALMPALIAIGVAWGISLVTDIVGLLRSAVWSFGGSGYNPFASFANAALLEPLLFFAGAGALLVLLLPIVPSAGLLQVMLRTTLAGVGGYVLLTLKGLIGAVIDAVRYQYGVPSFVDSWLGAPLSTALILTAFLVIGAVVAWVLASRRPAEAPAA